MASSVEQLVIRCLSDPFGQVELIFRIQKFVREIPRAYVHVVHCVPHCPVASRPYPGSIIHGLQSPKFDCTVKLCLTVY